MHLKKLQSNNFFPPLAHNRALTTVLPWVCYLQYIEMLTSTLTHNHCKDQYTWTMPYHIRLKRYYSIPTTNVTLFFSLSPQWIPLWSIHYTQWPTFYPNRLSNGNSLTHLTKISLLLTSFTLQMNILSIDKRLEKNKFYFFFFPSLGP